MDASRVHRAAQDIFGAGAPWALERADGGASATVYRVRLGGETFFLRLAEEETQNLEVDALVHRRLRAVGAAVPEVLHVDSWNEAVGRSVMVVRHIGGVPLTHTPDPGLRAAVLVRAGEDLAVINSVAVDGFGWVRRDRPGWPPAGEHQTYAAFVTSDLPEPWPGRFGELFSAGDLRTIESLLATEQQRLLDVGVLAHGDLGLDHIFHRDGTYAGIIDFGEIRGAEPLFDLGVFAAQAPRENRALSVDAILDGYGAVVPLPEDARARMRVAGTLKALRQLGRWIEPGFPHRRDPQALADLISRRFLPPLRAAGRA